MPPRDAQSPVEETAERYPPSDLEQWGIVAISQIRHYLRTYRFLGLVAFVGVVSALWLSLTLATSVGLLRFSYLNSISEFLTDYVASSPLWVVLAAAFFGGDALSIDFHSGAGYYTLVLPVKRGVLLAGRYASALAVTLVVVFAYDLFGLIGATYTFGAPALPWGSLWLSFGLTILFAFAALSVAFCFSAIFENPAAGVLLTVLVLFVALSTISDVVQTAGFEPWWSLYYAGGAIPNVLDWQFVAVQTIPIGGGLSETAWSATAAEGAEIMLAYIAVFFSLSVYLYHRKESKG